MRTGQVKKNSRLRRDINGVLSDKQVIKNAFNMSENEWSQLFYEAGIHLAEYYESEFMINPSTSPSFWDWFLVVKARFDQKFIQFAKDLSPYRTELFIAIEENVFKAEYLRFLSFDYAQDDRKNTR